MARPSLDRAPQALAEIISAIRAAPHTSGNLAVAAELNAIASEIEDISARLAARRQRS